MWPRRSPVRVRSTTPFLFKHISHRFRWLSTLKRSFSPSTVPISFCQFSLLLGLPNTQNLPKIYPTKTESQGQTRHSNQLSYDHHALSVRFDYRQSFMQVIRSAWKNGVPADGIRHGKLRTSADASQRSETLSAIPERTAPVQRGQDCSCRRWSRTESEMECLTDSAKDE